MVGELLGVTVGALDGTAVRVAVAVTVFGAVAEGVDDGGGGLADGVGVAVAVPVVAEAGAMAKNVTDIPGYVALNPVEVTACAARGTMADRLAVL